MTDRFDTYLESIRSAYPALAIRTIEYLGEGQNSDVLIANGEFVFRFPRYEHVLEGLRTEVAIVAGIRPHVTLEVPAPQYLALEGRPLGEAFVGYRRIPGEPLWRETFRGIRDPRVLDTVAAQLGSFLKELHGVPPEAIGCQLPLYDTYDQYVDLYGRIREKLYAFMRPDAREAVTLHFEKYLGDASDSAYDPILRHGDFGTSNILFDSQSGAIRGILDFGSAGLGDPAVDFAGLLSQYGEEFVGLCGRAYPGFEALVDRTRFYRGTFALQEALFGHEHGDRDAFRAGLEQYRL
jgi:aminoglycoside 2''-phosphotransferase